MPTTMATTSLTERLPSCLPIRLPSGFEAHVLFELGEVGFESRHFLVQVLCLVGQLRALCQVCDAAGEAPDDRYAVSEVVGGFHQDRFLSAAGCHELLNQLSPADDSAYEFSDHLQVFEVLRGNRHTVLSRINNENPKFLLLLSQGVDIAQRDNSLDLDRFAQRVGIAICLVRVCKIDGDTLSNSLPDDALPCLF